MTDSNHKQNSQDNHQAEQVSFFGKMLTFSRMKLLTDDFEVITAQLNIVSPTKDSLIPIVIDSEVDIDLQKLTDLLWESGLQPIGVTKGKLDAQAKELRLAIFPADGKRMQRVNTLSASTTRKIVPVAGSANDEPKDKPAKPAGATTSKPQTKKSDKTNTETATNDTADSKQTAAEPTKESNKSPVVFTTAPLVKFDQQQTAEGMQEPQDVQGLETDTPVQVIQVVEQVTSLVYDQMLRSGQSINHVGGDLILTNSVNDGAEAITDNSLHIYGRGMGRLVAGATGDQYAHIFCQRFNPSLVSVAGTYMLRDSIPPEVIDKPVQVSYKEREGLVFRVMDDWLNQGSNQGSNQGVITTR